MSATQRKRSFDPGILRKMRVIRAEVSEEDDDSLNQVETRRKYRSGSLRKYHLVIRYRIKASFQAVNSSGGSIDKKVMVDLCQSSEPSTKTFDMYEIADNDEVVGGMLEERNRKQLDVFKEIQKKMNKVLNNFLKEETESS